MADEILRNLDIGILDLIDPEEINEGRSRKFR